VIEKVKQDLIKVLRDARQAIKDRLFGNLHSISDHIIHSMSIYQDKDVVDVAVAIYALSKIYEKERHLKSKQIRIFTREILSLLKRAINNLEQNKEREFRETIKKVLADIHALDREINVYIEDVLEFAKIKKGSRLYEHGLSLGQAAATTGVSKWELMPATGETITHERFVEPIERKRLLLIKRLFKVKEL